MNGSPLALRSTLGNAGAGVFRARFGSISSGTAAKSFASPMTASAWTIGRGRRPSSTAPRGSRAKAMALRARSPASPGGGSRSKTLRRGAGSCSAWAVIDSSMTRAMHQGAAADPTQPRRERPIRYPSACVKKGAFPRRAEDARDANHSSYRRLRLRGRYRRRATAVPVWGRADRVTLARRRARRRARAAAFQTPRGRVTIYNLDLFWIPLESFGIAWISLENGLEFLGFIWISFGESGLFNGLRRFLAKKSFPCLLSASLLARQ